MTSISVLELAMKRLLLIAAIMLATGCPAAKTSAPGGKDTTSQLLTSPSPGQWAKIGQSVTFGDTKVTLVSVRIGKFQIRSVTDGEVRDSEEDAIVARVRMDNLSATKDLKFTSWQGVKGVSLVDERGTEYFVLGFVYDLRWHVVGALGFANAQPGESLEDVVRFKLPLAGAKTFHLTLPEQKGGDLTGPIPFRFEFALEDLKK